MKTQFTRGGDDGVTIEYDDMTGMRKRRTFVLNGDQVQELTSIQAHDSLAAIGAPLVANTSNFHAVMCAQFMMMMQADQKAAALAAIQPD